LNEKARIALREKQEQKALVIENKRRKAKGEELLTSLEEEDEEDQEDQASENLETADAEEEDESEDVLLTEAGNVLVDVLILKKERYAVHNGAEDME
jgi:carboxyl-terminal processing protease